MNQAQPYMDVPQSHAPASGPPPSMGHYSNYAQSQPIQPASHGYTSYAPYPYASMAPMQQGHPVTSSMGGQMVAQPLPTMGSNAQPPPQQGNQQFQTGDTTGQVAPPGMKPRVTATLWEDEGSLCFQVEANGVCVARREDNHMINGTKLLNVAGMTRGRRDGILKSEKTRHVVKIGPMHLKGVWIPFDRALDFANKEKITEMLYPLFVHNIGALLYHPTNQARGSIGNAAAMTARRPDQQAELMRPSAATVPQALQHHNTIAGTSMQQPQHSIAPHPSQGRPGLDRAHTFPTPPTSASSMTMVGNAGSSYEYGSQHASSMHSGQPLSIDTGMSARSVPTTPASTPPGNSQGIPQYATSQPYDSRQMYSAPSTYAAYGSQQNMGRYGGMHSSPGGVKTEMGPPSRAPTEHEHHEDKHHDAYGVQQDAGGDHEGEYTHTSASYDATRPIYHYKSNAAPGPPMHSDPSHVSPEMTHSPHQNGSRGATPRTTHPYAGYTSTPQRAGQLPASNLSYVMSNDTRAGAPNGPESYSAPAGYQPPHYPAMNGAPPSNKRMREVDDDQDPYGRPMSAEGLKRQRTDPGSRPISQPHSVRAGGTRR